MPTSSRTITLPRASLRLAGLAHGSQNATRALITGVRTFLDYRRDLPHVSQVLPISSSEVLLDGSQLISPAAGLACLLPASPLRGL